MWKTSLISDLTPPSLERSWQSTPHPSLPLVATSSADKTVRIYSLVNYKLLSVVSGGHKRSVRSSAWKPSTSAGVTKGESVLATGSFDATVGIWRRWDDYNDHNNGKHEHEHDHTHDHHDHGHDHDHDEEDEEEWRFAVLLDLHPGNMELEAIRHRSTSPARIAGQTRVHIGSMRRDTSNIWNLLDFMSFIALLNFRDHRIGAIMV